MVNSFGQRLEKYTAKRPEEVLIVTAEIDSETERIIIFKGFSSSLTRPTAFDPEVPILPDSARIIAIERVASPYNPDNPKYLQQGITVETMQSLLAEVGV